MNTLSSTNNYEYGSRLSGTATISGSLSIKLDADMVVSANKSNQAFYCRKSGMNIETLVLRYLVRRSRTWCFEYPDPKGMFAIKPSEEKLRRI